MSRNSRETILTLGYIIAGLAGAVLAGWLQYGSKFSPVSLRAVPYLIVAFCAGLMYASARFRGPYSAALVLLLLYFIYVAAFPPIRPSTAANAAVFVVPVGLSILASVYALKALSRIPIGRFILMAVLVGLGYAVMLAVFLAREGRPLVPNLILRQAVLGVWLGGTVGFGFELVDLLGRRLHTSRPRTELPPLSRRP